MKHIALLLTIALSLPALAQPAKKPAPVKAEIHKKVYALALANGDATAAVNSLYYIIAEEGAKSPYRDSLALMYFNMSQYTLCEKVAAELVVIYADSIAQGKRLTMLEILALSQSQLGKVKEAIESFEKLLDKTGEMFHAFRLAELQYRYKRVGEATQTIFKAETLNNSMQGNVKIDIGNNTIQEVLLEAAVQNLKGFILLEASPNDKTAAIAAFKKALEIQPNFILAKNNLDFAEGRIVPKEGN